MLNISDIFWSTPAGREILAGVSLTLEPGTMCGLIGPSGGGKSVLLKLIGGIYEPLSGTIQAPIRDNRDIGLMFQEGALFDSLTVFDNIAFPLVSGKVPACCLPREVLLDVREKVSEILARVGLTKSAYKLPCHLSGGMRRRVSLARALVARPKLLLLDDPTSGLDPVASSVIMRLITEMHEEYQPITLIVSHDLRRLIPRVDQVFALFEGKIKFSGNLKELQSCSYREINHFVSCRYDMVASAQS